MPKAPWILALTAVVVPLLVGHSFGAEWEDPPWGQPTQMQSQVNYDPKLSDPFFDTVEWSDPFMKDFRNEMGKWERKEVVEKLTAKCFTSFQGKHRIKFCDAKLLDGDRIELFIHERTAGDNDQLRIIIRDGVFRSQYWHVYLLGTGTRLPAGVRWTTTRQKLTLDKKVYRKGDLIKGKIDFECSEAVAYFWLPFLSEPTRTITINGIFKTVLE